MRQRRQLPPHFSVQERVHALAISYKTNACMREVNYITVTDHTCTIIRDLMVGEKPAALITTKRRRKGNLYFVDILYICIPLTKCALFS